MDQARAITLRQLLLGGGLLLLLCLAMMLALLAWSIAAADRNLERAGTSQTQLTLVTRLEADANALMLRPPEARDIDTHIAAYLASIETEGRLHAAPASQAGERQTARQLAAAFARVRNGGTAQDLAHLRALVRLIGERERAEVAAVMQEMDRLRARAIGAALVVVALISAIFASVGWALWRAVARPLQALERGTAMLAGGTAPARVSPSGIAELRAFADRFNDMAGQVEEQVRARTAELEASNCQLGEIDRTRRLFFSKVSHELRTPVTVMRGEADVALRNGQADVATLREALEHISANGGFLQRRLDDLLGLARSEDGRIALSPAPVDLADIVRAASDAALPFARSSEVALRLRIDTPSVPVTGDAAWLTQSLLAIIDNAVKFAGPEGGIGVMLDRRSHRARIEISDSGDGVDTIDLARLFDPYFQTKAGRSRGGTGLGLSLARWIVEQHGGVISARNADQGGLIVAIDLPIANWAVAA